MTTDRPTQQSPELIASPPKRGNLSMRSRDEQETQRPAGLLLADDDGASEPDFSKLVDDASDGPACWTGMVTVEIRPLSTDHSGRKAVDAVNALAQAEGWPTFAEPALLRQLIDAPGTLSLIAIVSTAPDPGVVGFAHALTNGHHAYLSVIVVDTAWRGRGVGRQLMTSLFQISGVERLDLLSGPESAAFYARLPKSPDDGLSPLPTSAKHWS